MNRKLLAACMVIAAFSVVPSLAAAKPVLTHPTGTVLPVTTGGVPTKIKATNVGNTKMTISGLPTLECTTAVLTGDLHINETTKGIEGEITSAEFGGTGSKIAGDVEPECTGGAGPSGVTVTSLPWCIEATEDNDNFALKGGKCTAATSPITFDLSVTSIFGTITCKYIKNTKVTGTFTTHSTGDAVGTISEVGFARHESSELCPSEGKLDMSFTLETDLTNEFKPLWISS